MQALYVSGPANRHGRSQLQDEMTTLLDSSFLQDTEGGSFLALPVNKYVVSISLVGVESRILEEEVSMTRQQNRKE
jgi:hypothetical protein|tara:strand:- start:210 stop:437 length:228 start_codon:yes stop_codon:yes gene_type:complete